MDGAVWPTHFHHTMDPHSTQMHKWHTYVSNTAPARFLWCVQQNAPPLEPLLSHARHNLPPTAIILCPESHPYHEQLSTRTHPYPCTGTCTQVYNTRHRRHTRPVALHTEHLVLNPRAGTPPATAYSAVYRATNDMQSERTGTPYPRAMGSARVKGHHLPPILDHLKPYYRAPQTSKRLDQQTACRGIEHTHRCAALGASTVATAIVAPSLISAHHQ